MIGYLANPLLLFLAVWGVTLALYLAGVFAGLFPSPHALTVGALLINALAFPLGYVTWTAFEGLTPLRIDSPRASIRPLTQARIRRALRFTLAMGVIALLLILYRVVVIAAYFDTPALELLMQPAMLRLRLVTFIETGTSQTDLMVMLLSLTGSLYAVGFVLLGVFLRVDGTARRYLYLLGFLLVALATSLANLSRYDMTVYVLYVILAYCVTDSWTGGEKARPTVWHLLIPVLGVVAMFVIVEVLLSKSASFGQADRFRGVLFSLYWYLASPIAALNEWLANFQGPYDLGQNTFFPFYKWLHRFHLVGQPDMSVYGEFVFVPYIANAYTYLRIFYEDFGLLGVAIVPYVFGWLLAAVQSRANRYFAFLNLYVVLLIPIAFSFFSYPPLSIQFYFQILFGFLFFRYAIGPPGQSEARPRATGEPAAGGRQGDCPAR